MQSRSCTSDGRVGRPRPDHSDDVQVAERHDGGRHDQDVAGEERQVDLALPLGRVAARPARQAPLLSAAATAAVVRLDEDEELRQCEDERHQPRSDHLERDRRPAAAQRLQWLDQHLYTEPTHQRTDPGFDDGVLRGPELELSATESENNTRACYRNQKALNPHSRSHRLR